ncbi:PhoH family protein [Magnetococcus marinus MC-1]|uniref:PhoH-like protein n=1 Tax=Magnetococcus marinus (strain ATCC BAA-1437 / JCM 17883 / MC-1) TaxID=156889 RepID=A0L7K4_MAGMM|nr:PhoH family protein [Magnetococcus marinus]ABK43947.1 PhoH family protein [Magnetococcus marinus MC-1]
MSKTICEDRLTFPDNGHAMALFGDGDSHLRLLEKELEIAILPRGNELLLKGRKRDLKKATGLLNALYEKLLAGEEVPLSRVSDGLRAVRHDEPVEPLYSGDLAIKTPRISVYPRTTRQALYVEAMRRHEMTFAVGPAGTGKTFLAVAAAVEAWQEKLVKRIILTRPAVEAGENLGFLPGDLQAKIDPYLRPLYDALYAMVGAERVEKMVAAGELEIAPLAYMRGRTLGDAFIILDEAQNTTHEQMKMFLTRLGENGRMVVAGDETQIDLPRGQNSGFVQALKVLGGVEGIHFSRFTADDVVRHTLVERIVRAYDSATPRPQNMGNW